MRGDLSYLLLSVALSAGRSIASKKTATAAKEMSVFFFCQSVLFFSASVLLIAVNGHVFSAVSAITVLYGVLYGVLLVLSQWMFVIALRSGSASLCTVIYSLGFVLPTVSGALFWGEEFTAVHVVGLLLALAVILLTAKREKGAGDRKTFMPYILLAMLASGGLGILQKVQQSSQAAGEKGAFLVIAFALAFLCSLIAFLLCHKKIRLSLENTVYPLLTGVCFGGANLCNTVLAGRMESAVFFPVQNIGTILLSALLSVVLCKEKMTGKTAAVLLLGSLCVVVFSL